MRFSLFTKSSNGFKDIGVEQLDALPPTARIIDVREASEYEADHLPEAELVPLGSLGRAAAAWDKSAPYVVLCRSGGRSRRGAADLVSLGFTNVMNLEGGMMAVRSLRRP